MQQRIVKLIAVLGTLVLIVLVGVMLFAGPSYSLGSNNAVSGGSGGGGTGGTGGTGATGGTGGTGGPGPTGGTGGHG